MLLLEKNMQLTFLALPSFLQISAYFQKKCQKWQKNGWLSCILLDGRHCAPLIRNTINRRGPEKDKCPRQMLRTYVLVIYLAQNGLAHISKTSTLLLPTFALEFSYSGTFFSFAILFDTHALYIEKSNTAPWWCVSLFVLLHISNVDFNGTTYLTTAAEWVGNKLQDLLQQEFGKSYSGTKFGNSYSNLWKLWL